MKLDDRMALYESQTTSRKLIPRLPVLVRLDGKNFSKFTSNCDLEKGLLIFPVSELDIRKSGLSVFKVLSDITISAFLYTLRYFFKNISKLFFKSKESQIIAIFIKKSFLFLYI